MIYSPTKKNKINALIIITAFILLLIFILLVSYFSLPNAIWQGAFFVEAIILCEILTKFVLPVYTYTVDENAFTIVKTLGKRTLTVCNIDTSRIVSICPLKEYKKQEHHDIANVHNYNANIVTNSCYALVFEYSSSSEAVMFEPSEEMVKLILSLIKNQ